MAISVDVIPNRSSPPAIQFRQAWREGSRIRRRTIANLSKMPPEMVDAIRAMLKGGVVFACLDEAVTIRRALPHGHVAAALGTLDWLGSRQPFIERSLANRHLRGGNTLVLYDVTSSFLEGECCPLAAFGHSRDGRTGRKQITFGLLCAGDGCPVALLADAVAEISSPDFPGERLMVCLNPRLRAERSRKREDLLQATQAELGRIAGLAVRSRPGPALRDRINRALGRTANRRKVARLFDIETGNDGMRWSRNEERIAAEARLDGIYVIRTSLDADDIGAAEAVEACKSLSRVERAFRLMKTSRLEVRPVHVCSAGRVRAHVFLCMLALYVEWHLRRRLAPLLYGEDDPQGARALRNSPVEKAVVSESAGKKAATKRTAEGFPVHGMTTLLADLATLTLNEVMLPTSPDHVFEMLAQQTLLQRRAFELLEIDPARIVASTSPG